MKYDPSKIRDYYFLFKKSINFFYILLSLFCAFTIIFAGTVHGFDKTTFWIFTIITILFQILLTIVFRKISKPQLDLSKVIFSISNKISPGNIPVPKPENYSNAGFSEVLKLIYTLDFRDYEKNTKLTRDNNRTPEIISNIPVGISVLRLDNSIAYHNKYAPNFNQLRDDKTQEIFRWIEKCRQSKIRDFKIWERVSNTFDNPSDQKLYDIVVFFEKQFKDDVIIYFIDKTSTYWHDENDLNFIAFAAHELRGPITIIRGYLDILNTELSSMISNEQKDLITRLIVSSNRLNGYINNILDVAKFDQNRLEFSPEEHSINEIFEEIYEDISMRASAQNRHLDISLPHNLPTVNADIYGASEVFINLIDNAIKYSNDGGIIKVWAEESGNFIDINIQDYGIGIPENVIGNLFTKFYRSHRSRETVAGSGIGLYVSKAIVEMLSGKISVKSTEGKGSTFTVSLPIYSKLSDVQQNKIPQVQIKNHGKVF